MNPTLALSGVSKSFTMHLQDGIVLREYLETVAREREGWRDLYDALKELAS